MFESTALRERPGARISSAIQWPAVMRRRGTFRGPPRAATPLALVREHRPALRERREERAGSVPGFVRNELKAFITCRPATASWCRNALAAGTACAFLSGAGATGMVSVTSFQDDFAFAISPDMLCSPLELWFDGACRNATWFESNLSTPGTMVTVAGSRYKAGSGMVPLTEQSSSDVFERFAVSDAHVAISPTLSLSVGPTRSGYIVEGMMRQRFFDEGNSTYTLLTESLMPTISMEPGIGWFWDVTGWDSTTYRAGSNPVHCDANGCISLYTGGGYSCEQIKQATESRVKNQCMTAGTGCLPSSSAERSPSAWAR